MSCAVVDVPRVRMEQKDDLEYSRLRPWGASLLMGSLKKQEEEGREWEAGARVLQQLQCIYLYIWEIEYHVKLYHLRIIHMDYLRPLVFLRLERFSHMTCFRCSLFSRLGLFLPCTWWSFSFSCSPQFSQIYFCLQKTRGQSNIFIAYITFCA